jgi:hypothetical protein
MKPEIRAKVHFYPTTEGGRLKATPADHFGCPLSFGGRNFDCRLLLDDIGPVSPGETVEVPIQFLCPEDIVPRLRPGDRFQLWEGGFIGEGEVLEIPDSES